MRSLTLLLLMAIAVQPFSPPEPPAPSSDDAARLTKAVHDGETDSAAALIDVIVKSGQPLPTLPDGRSMLHLAAEKASPEMIAMLLQRGLPIQATDALKRTPLHRAHSLTAAALIEAGANILATDALGNLPLHYAAEQGGDHCRLYVERRLPVDARNNSGLSPLHFACLAGNAGAVAWLLDHGADVNAKTAGEYQYLPWWFDPESNRPRSVRAGSTPMSIAQAMHRETKWSSGRYAGIVETLAARGAIAPPASRPMRRLAFIALSLPGFVAFFWLLMQIDSRMTGWHALAERYAAPVTPAQVHTGQDGGVGRIGLLRLKSLHHAAATDEGLYFAPPKWLRWGHAPLMVPWQDLAITSDQSILGIEVLELRAPPSDGELIVLRGGIAPEVRSRLARQ